MQAFRWIPNLNRWIGKGFKLWADQSVDNCSDDMQNENDSHPVRLRLWLCTVDFLKAMR